MDERFETYSFLPPLTPQQVDAHIDQILEQKLVPMIEYNDTTSHTHNFWHVWHLPKGATPTKLLIKKMLGQCAQNHPAAFVRLNGYSRSKRQNTISFIVHAPQS